MDINTIFEKDYGGLTEEEYNTQSEKIFNFNFYRENKIHRRLVNYAERNGYIYGYIYIHDKDHFYQQECEYIKKKWFNRQLDRKIPIKQIETKRKLKI